ncbi:DUF5133 domain-containing protein [[Kitasatospora] papulosa]|uniref:DUF5133 domain-containing protein n=1 Tax=[Kitasatospora] papulosa TaxID=1464011 RepID=UPI0036B07F12
MLMANPATLRNLVTRYEALRSTHARLGTPESRRQLEDVSYTLCVTTGTRAVPDALAGPAPDGPAGGGGAPPGPAAVPRPP